MIVLASLQGRTALGFVRNRLYVALHDVGKQPSLEMTGAELPRKL